MFAKNTFWAITLELKPRGWWLWYPGLCFEGQDDRLKLLQWRKRLDEQASFNKALFQLFLCGQPECSNLLMWQQRAISMVALIIHPWNIYFCSLAFSYQANINDQVWASRKMFKSVIIEYICRFQNHHSLN